MHSTRRTALLFLGLLPFLAGTAWFARRWVVAESPRGALAGAAGPEGEAVDMRGVRRMDPAPTEVVTPALATVTGVSRVEVEEDLGLPDVCRITVRTEGRLPEGLELTLQQLVPMESRLGAGQTVRVERRGGSTTAYMGHEQVITPITRPVQVVEVPRAEYSHVVLHGAIHLALGKLDATGPEAKLDVFVPANVGVNGEVSSSMRGPLAGVALSASSEGVGLRELVHTDSAGRFAFDFLASGPIRVSPVWSEDWVCANLWSRAALEPPIDPSSPSARYVIDEGLLRIVEDPPSPLLHGFRTSLRRRGDPEDSSRKQAVAPFADLLAHELYLPPGTYDLERKFDARTTQTQQVTLRADETRELVLDCSAIAVVALDVLVDQHEKRELRFRVRDAHGDVVAFERVRRPDDELYVYREVVDPGTYTVEVELVRRGARSTEEAIAVWRGEIVALPGARAPIRVFLP